MPIISIDELKLAVIKGDVGAISIDTSTVEKYQYGFETGLLAKMSQFSRLDTDHLVLDIILHEMKSHLLGQADLIKTQVQNSLKPLGNSWGIEKERRDEVLKSLFGEQTVNERTEKRLQDFLYNTSATILECADLVDLQQVLSRYTETKPPFGNKEAKKNEFPDAIALLALEGWAAKNKKVIAVSNDGDWKRFCADSDLIYFVDNLAHALSVFQGDADDAAKLFRAALDAGKLDDLDEYLLDAINSQSDKIRVDFEAAASWYYESELVQVTVSANEPLIEQVKGFEVVEYANNTLVIQTTLTVDVTPQFVVSFDLWDYVDREYVGMGSTTVEATEEMDLNLVITTIFEDGQITIDSAELLPEGIVMDFGEIEPDWMGDSSEEDETR
ncbi:PIN domain-containing protein [Alcaligenes faecalis]|uniref:PIN domain-containing protein n=1 Tax=Alcaligenes faecalis TaxID=511 RepID=UPI000F0B7566|nr:PIN domain-containing protein [Alcaligenes faecalis]AYR19469.1 hypothetical protein D6I95_03270 [Alcaligenes faecalis]